MACTSPRLALAQSPVSMASRRATAVAISSSGADGSPRPARASWTALYAPDLDAYPSACAMAS